MTAFPATANAFLENGIDQGTLRQRHQDFLLATRQLIGAAGIEDLTIASGAITPTRGTVRVEGQGAAADDLVSIATTNLPEGSLLLLSIKDEGHIITVKHGTGAGNTSLAGGLDFAMNKLEQALVIQRRGTLWYEYARWGREASHVVGAAGEPAFQNSWASAHTPRFWKDSDGVVHLAGSAFKASPGTSEIIFTLPAGYRPGGTVAYWPVVADDTAPARQIDVVWIQNDGDVLFRKDRTYAAGNVTVYFDGIAPFRAAL